jgi:perosamine synthetase
MIDIDELLIRINSVLPRNPANSIALHEPFFSGNEVKYLQDCIETGWVSSSGKYIDKFENEISKFTGVKNVIAVVNGTAALHLCLIASGVKPGDEVITPTLTFIATANAVTYCQAIPLFADCDATTLSIDPVKVNNFLKTHAQMKGGFCYNTISGNRISALIAMHVFGHPGKIEELANICRIWNIKLIEDAAESLGSFYKGRHTGSFGHVSAISFNGNKIITTGGGGAVLTDDDFAAKKVRHLSTTAKVPHQLSFVHDAIGFNYRMPNLNAALGCGQLEKLPDYLLKKRALSQKYFSALEGLEGLKLLAEPPHGQSNYWLNTIILDPIFENQLDDVLNGLIKNGIQARPCWTLMHKLKIYEKLPRISTEVAESFSRRIINLPSSQQLYF